MSGGSALVAEPMFCTTLPKADEADTSSAKAPMTQALLAHLGSKVTDDNPANDDPNLLNFIAVMSWIACWMCHLLHMYWLDSRKPDRSIWHSERSSFHAP
jgi:hypothetical protein